MIVVSVRAGEHGRLCEREHDVLQGGRGGEEPGGRQGVRGDRQRDDVATEGAAEGRLPGGSRVVRARTRPQQTDQIL